MPQSPGLPLCSLRGAPQGAGTPDTPSPLRAQGFGECTVGGWGRFPGRAVAMSPPKSGPGFTRAESGRPDRRRLGAAG